MRAVFGRSILLAVVLHVIVAGAVAPARAHATSSRPTEAQEATPRPVSPSLPPTVLPTSRPTSPDALPDLLPAQRYLAGDMHNHTLLSSDAMHTQSEITAMAFSTYGLDWLCTGDHGGKSRRKSTGAPIIPSTWMWRTLPVDAYAAVLAQRVAFPGQSILQGFEWNVPTHDHATVGIVADEPSAIATFEYMFDAQDKADTMPLWEKRNKTRTDAISAARWLAERYSKSSYLIVVHPSRKQLFTARDLRDLNNAAPSVAFGFEGLLGRQKMSSRGSYKYNFSPTSKYARTYGGADYFTAKVGGVWDSLLGEGRKFFTFVDSDFHDPSSDFWPGEYAKTYVWADTTQGTDGIVAGMRSGNSYSVTGGIIDQLTFTAGTRHRSATMGQRLIARRGDDVTITVTFRVPATRNHTTPPQVDHIDLIHGRTHAKYRPGTRAYRSTTNPTAKIIRKTRPTAPWMGTEPDGSTYRVKYTLPKVRNSGYIRLRGTNLGLRVPGQTDRHGNPLMDKKSRNTAAKAWADCWFYSNPIYIKVVR